MSTPAWINALPSGIVKTDLLNDASNNVLSYGAALQILTDVENQGPVTATEFSALQTIAANLNNGLSASDYVVSIFTQLVDGSPANATWTGGSTTTTALGNLQVGTTSSQLSELIGQWFLGTNLPDPSLPEGTIGQEPKYSAISAPLYGPSGAASVNDICQGEDGDCELFAGLIEDVENHPQQLASMIVSDGGGVYGVRFYVGGNEVWETVNTELPTLRGYLAYGFNPNYQNSALWVGLVEKAYAQLSATGEIGHPAEDSYNNISADYAYEVLENLVGATGGEYYYSSSSNWYMYKSFYIDALESGDDIVLETSSTAADTYDSKGNIELVGDHAFAVVGYDSSTGDFIVRNPWGNSCSGQNWDAQFEVSLSDIASVDGDFAIDNAGGATSAVIISLYDTYFGRDPTAYEIGVWQGLLQNGATFATLQAALVADPTGQAHTAAVIKQLYDTYFGRDPTASEISVWQGLLGNGATFATLQAALVADPTGQTHTAAVITQLYDTYFGRDPTASEISVWQGLIENGATFATLQNALVAAPTGQAHTAAVITQLYDTYFGRDPTTSEISVWQGLLENGATFATLQAALLSDPSGVAHTNAEITVLYDAYFGRDPTASEIGVWQGLIKNGATFATLQAALMSDPAGQAHAAILNEITTNYDMYFGRDPLPSEQKVWSSLIAGGATANTLRAALLNDPTGVAHTNAEITSLYDTYFGRDPTASEINVWKGLIQNGATFTTLQGALLADPTGQAHTAATIKQLYDTYFGRDPTASEVTVWQGLFAGGTTVTQLTDVLTEAPASLAPAGQHVAGTTSDFNNATLRNLASTGDIIDLTDLNIETLTASFAENAADTGGVLTVSDGAHAASINLIGQYMAASASGSATAAGFVFRSDGAQGTNISFLAPGH